VSAIGTKQTCSNALTNVPLLGNNGHDADVQTALMNVRFEGNNGHDADVTRCLLMTQSGHFVSFAPSVSERMGLARMPPAPVYRHLPDLRRKDGPGHDDKS